MKMIKRFEKKYIPRVRKKKYYVVIKAITLIPILFVIHIIKSVVVKLISKVVISRKGKPDIVLQNIIDGWANLTFPDKQVEVLAKGRAAICAECPFAIAGGVHTVAVDGKVTSIRGMKCGKCGCPLSAKVRSPNDSCPENRW